MPTPTTNPAPASDPFDLAVSVRPIAAVAPGGATAATLEINNRGPGSSRGDATLTVIIPGGATLGTPLPAGCTGGGLGAVCSVRPGLDAGTARHVTIPIRVNSDVRGGATLAGGRVELFSWSDSAPTNNSASFVVPTSTPPDLAVTVAVPASAVVPGTDATATITVANLGPSTTVRPTTISVRAPRDTVLTPPQGCMAGAQLACTVPPGFVAGGQRVIAVPVSVAPGAPVGAQLAGGRASIISAGDPAAANNTADFAVRTAARVVADIAVRLRPTTPVSPGARGQLVVELRNQGPADGRASSTVTVTLPAGVSAVASSSCRPHGVTLTCSVGPIRAYTSLFLEALLWVSPTAPARATLRGGSVQARSLEDPRTINNRVTFDVSTGRAASDLAVSVEKIEPIAPNAAGTVTVSLANAGPARTASPSIVEIHLPDKAVLDAARILPSGCVARGPLIVCILAAGRPSAGAGKGVVRLSLPVLVLPHVPLLSRLTGGVVTVTNRDDPNHRNDQAVLELPVAATSTSLRVLVTAPDQLGPGERIVLTVTVRNTGSSTANRVSVIVKVPQQVQADLASLPQCVRAGTDVNCTIGTLRPGESRQFSVPASVPLGASDAAWLSFTATASAVDAAPSTASDVISVRGSQPASLIGSLPAFGVAALTLGGLAWLWRGQGRTPAKTSPSPAAHRTAAHRATARNQRTVKLPTARPKSLKHRTVKPEAAWPDTARTPAAGLTVRPVRPARPVRHSTGPRHRA